jgi:hypothetical protein
VITVEHPLAQESDWTEAAIEKRRDAIAQWALQRWHVNLPNMSHSVQPKQPANAEERLLQLADGYGTGEAFRAIMAAARKHPIYLRMQRNWDGIQFTPVKKKNAQLFWLGPDLWWGTVYSSVFEEYYHIPRNRVQELLDFERGRSLKAEEVNELIKRLDLLFASIAESSSTSAAGQVAHSIG